MKVLLCVDHAPLYREPFFSGLAKECDLTVIASDGVDLKLAYPKVREGYRYLQLEKKSIFKYFLWQKGLVNEVLNNDYDVVCMSFNLRHLDRMLAFFFYRHRAKSWVWRGHIFGGFNNKIVNKFRIFLLRRARATLVYSELITTRLSALGYSGAVSFNNSEVLSDDFRAPVKRFLGKSGFRLLFVGRAQKRKKLERLVGLAKRRKDVFVRLVGPGMDELDLSNSDGNQGNIEVFPQTTGPELDHHFEWCDFVANPGHVGLLVMNSARYGVPIVIDNNSSHAPEVWLAREANQVFISWGDDEVVDSFLGSLSAGEIDLFRVGLELQTVACSKYTVEHMVTQHLLVFKDVCNGKV